MKVKIKVHVDDTSNWIIYEHVTNHCLNLSYHGAPFGLCDFSLSFCAFDNFLLKLIFKFWSWSRNSTNEPGSFRRYHSSESYTAAVVDCDTARRPTLFEPNTRNTSSFSQTFEIYERDHYRLSRVNCYACPTDAPKNCRLYWNHGSS